MTLKDFDSFDDFDNRAAWYALLIAIKGKKYGGKTVDDALVTMGIHPLYQNNELYKKHFKK
jgi:hypothetical protein